MAPRIPRRLLAVTIAVAACLSQTITGASGSPAARAAAAPLSAAVHATERLLQGIPQSGELLGQPDAPVTMTWYGDLECPICREFAVGRGFRTLVTRDVRAGKVNVRYDTFCTTTCNFFSSRVFILQDVAALAAGEQKHFFDYALLFYYEQGAEGSRYVNEAFLSGLARAVPGLDLAGWSAARTNPAFARSVRDQDHQGVLRHIMSTPTLVVSGPGGRVQLRTAVPSYAQLHAAIVRVS